MTVKTIKKKQKHKGRGTVRTITKQVPSDSFFNFFSPLKGEPVRAARGACSLWLSGLSAALMEQARGGTHVSCDRHRRRAEPWPGSVLFPPSF